jgi:DNA repair protein RadA/Sms
MVLAVLEAHGGLRLGMHDVYLNVAGGLRITEPAADLAAAAALVSSLSGTPLPSDTVFFGELGLSGAIRPVAQAQARLKEAAKLGFAKAVSPAPRTEKGERLPLATQAVGHIADLVAGIAAERPRRPVPVSREM